MESRKRSALKPVSLPHDFLKMVEDTVSEKFNNELMAYREVQPNAFFKVRGELFSEEVLLAVSLMSEQALSATTAYASTDYKESDRGEILQTKLDLLVDTLDELFQKLFSEKNDQSSLKKLADPVLSILEDVPLEWAKVGSTQVFTRVDKANILLDEIADDWLAKNDPDWAEKVARIEKATESLFVTGRSRDSSIKH